MSEDEKQRRIERRLSRLIDEARGGKDQWWKRDSKDAFMDLGREMLRLGAGLTEIEHHIGAVMDAMRQEYGD